MVSHFGTLSCKHGSRQGLAQSPLFRGGLSCTLVARHSDGKGDESTGWGGVPVRGGKLHLHLLQISPRCFTPVVFTLIKAVQRCRGLTAQTVLGLHACLLLDSLAPVPVSDIPQSRPGKVDMCGLNQTQGHPVCYNASLVGCLAGVEKTEGQHLARPSQRVRGHGVHIYGAPQVEEN